MSGVRGVTRFRVGGASGFVVALGGRAAWALAELMEAGARGVTPLDNPAPRWAAYVHRLRGAGIAIEAAREAHGGAFPGRHARYRLACGVERLAEATA